MKRDLINTRVSQIRNLTPHLQTNTQSTESPARNKPHPSRKSADGIFPREKNNGAATIPANAHAAKLISTAKSTMMSDQSVT